MIKKILFPYDGSEDANEALVFVKEIALTFNSQVIIVNCYKMPVIPFSDENTHTYLKEIESGLEKHSEKIINEAKNYLYNFKINIKTIKLKVFEINTGSSIKYAADKEKPDLVIMGRRGLGIIKSLLLGSVSNYLIHHLNCPVLLISEKERKF